MHVNVSCRGIQIGPVSFFSTAILTRVSKEQHWRVFWTSDWASSVFIFLALGGLLYFNDRATCSCVHRFPDGCLMYLNGIWSITPSSTFGLLKLSQLPLLCHFVCTLGWQALFHATSRIAASLTTVSLSAKCGHAYVLLPRPTSTIVLCIIILFCGCADVLDVTWSYPLHASSPKQKWDFVQKYKASERSASKQKQQPQSWGMVF